MKIFKRKVYRDDITDVYRFPYTYSVIKRLALFVFSGSGKRCLMYIDRKDV